MGPRFYFISLISTIVLAQAVMAATTTGAPTPNTEETTTPHATTPETTTPPATTPETTTPYATTPETTTPHATTPETTTPPATTPETTTPHATTSEITTPHATTPETTTPHATTPETTTPHATTPETTTPYATTPETTTPHTTTPETTTQHATSPETTTPHTTTAETKTPGPTTPETTTPHATTLETTTPGTTTPEATTPEASTSESTTPETTTPKPTTPEPISTQTFGIRDNETNTFCIVLVGKLEFEIPYETADDKDKSAIIPVPINHTVNGSCRYKESDKAQQFILSFFNDWSVSVIIQQSPTVSFARRRLLAETVTYNWIHIELKYVIDENFPNAKDNGTKKTATTKPKFEALQSKKGDSYKCEADQTIHIDDIGDEDIKLVLSNFQYTAFAQQANTTFENEGVTECKADKKKDDHVGAIVGGAVGGTVGLIIIVGIVMYCRNRRRKDYVVM